MIMSINQKQMSDKLKFHPLVADAYSDVQKWLADYAPAQGFRDIQSPRQIDLKGTDALNTAAQFDTYMPGHAFKVQQTLAELIQQNRFGMTTGSEYLIFIDVGCGGGAATAALISTLLSSGKVERLPPVSHILCVGMDPNQEALHIYEQFLLALQRQLATLPGKRIELLYALIRDGVPCDTLQYAQLIRHETRHWQVKHPQLLLAEVNIVSFLDKQHREEMSARSFGAGVAEWYTALCEALQPSDATFMTIAAASSPHYVQRAVQLGTIIQRAFEDIPTNIEWSTENWGVML